MLIPKYLIIPYYLFLLQSPFPGVPKLKNYLDHKLDAQLYHGKNQTFNY